MRRSTADTGLIARLDGDVLRVLRVAGYAYQYASKLTREPIPTSTGILGRVDLAESETIECVSKAMRVISR